MCQTLASEGEDGANTDSVDQRDDGDQNVVEIDLIRRKASRKSQIGESEDRDQQLWPVLIQDSNDRIRPDTGAIQAMRQLVGPSVQLAIANLPALADSRNRIGIATDHSLESLVHALSRADLEDRP